MACGRARPNAGRGRVYVLQEALLGTLKFNVLFYPCFMQARQSLVLGYTSTAVPELQAELVPNPTAGRAGATHCQRS